MENNVSKKHLQATILVRCLGILKIFANFEPRVLNDCTKMVLRLIIYMLGAFNYHVHRRRWVGRRLVKCLCLWGKWFLLSLLPGVFECSLTTIMNKTLRLVVRKRLYIWSQPKTFFCLSQVRTCIRIQEMQKFWIFLA